MTMDWEWLTYVSQDSKLPIPSTGSIAPSDRL